MPHQASGFDLLKGLFLLALGAASDVAAIMSVMMAGVIRWALLIW